MRQAQEMVDRLVRATNAHDIEALVGCFATDYANQTPLHPARNFSGRDQVRKNWEQIFGFIPDLHAEVLHQVVDNDTAWTEWEMQGTRRDGTAHHMRGVVVFGVRDGLAQWAHFYLEPVDENAGTADEAVRAQVVRA
ncbi:MAG: nuclear transport factor 2 family protein [Candidatus Dormibacteraeota bacterium]|nr:nuclear transport factor 2 family protein [Candidatus Dormibacteraeota bacterium]